MGFLLDTNVLSEPKQKRPEQKVLDWLVETEEDTHYISVISLGEIEQGIAKLGNTKRAKQYREWLEDDLKTQFTGCILDIDQTVAQAWGRLTGELMRSGRPLSVVDSLLAATALSHHLTLVTRDARDFAGTKVKVLNPWKR